ncbi:NAD/NADP octopine/nopaline dehydrogenase family protein [Spelaeicoccus albus]|uniref:Opine dehydrogenase n=1 Tax=Spelaeicoccus albus TaxID=1280376 RepID=A0A7Z0A9X7_9MICO|nr:NAD/NADP octopine/nopaline dehydrogenase family protein [Spelaeicoccus albus]NYI67114.1 opine dehydrogenase [Spelaeicoccus albus]
MTQAKTVAVLGAGSTGRAMAGFLALSGYRVRLWNRQGGDETDELVSGLAATPELTVSGRLEGTAVLDDVTTDIGAAVTDADVVVVCTTANGHHDVGRLVAGYSAADQAVLLMPAGTLGSLEFVRGLVAGGCIATPLIAETSTTLFGSALDGATGVRISGQKAQVGVASLPSGRTDEIRRLIPEIPFVDVPDVLQSGFENVGASLHVTPMVLNAGWIETHGGTFKYYREAITPAVANVAAQVEEERMRIASAFGYRPTPLSTYLTQSVGAPEGTLYESLHGCEMYADAISPSRLDHRFLWEDALAGVVPLLSLAEVAGVPAPTMQALATLAGPLLGRDMLGEGRNVDNLGLAGMTVEGLRTLVSDVDAFDAWRRG